MDKFSTKDVGGLPLVLDDFRQFLGRLTGPANHGIYQAFNNILGGFGSDFVVQGCVVSGATGAKSITEGWIMLSGELIKVDAQGPFDEAVNKTFTKVTTFDSRGNKAFQNGSINDTYEKNRGVISGLAGSLDFDGNTFFQLTNQADFRDDTPAEAGIITLKKKVIEIGTWNMDVTDTVDVNHGITGLSPDKVRRVEAIIQRDDGVSVSPLNVTEFSTEKTGGSVQIVSTVLVRLKRTLGEFFDKPDFDDAVINRGWITIEYEA